MADAKGGPYDLSIKSHLLKEANTDIKTEMIKSERNRDLLTYVSPQYRDTHYLHSVTAKYLPPQHFSPNGHISGDLSKPALLPLDPINSSHRLSPSSPHQIPRHLQSAPFIPFGFGNCANFAYAETKSALASPSLFFQNRHLDYPISPPQTPILRSDRLSANYSSNATENSHTSRHAIISPVHSEYRPQYLSNWNEHTLAQKTNQESLIISSPTPSLNGSDDSGRGSAHSRGSTLSSENVSKYYNSVKADNKNGKPRKAVTATDANATRYQCTDCNKSYSTFSGLSKHQEFHCATQTKKAFSCKHCEKVYVSLGALKMHIRTHTLPCKCKLCGKAFSRPWLLQGMSNEPKDSSLWLISVCHCKVTSEPILERSRSNANSAAARSPTGRTWELIFRRIPMWKSIAVRRAAKRFPECLCWPNTKTAVVPLLTVPIDCINWHTSHH